MQPSRRLSISGVDLFIYCWDRSVVKCSSFQQYLAKKSNVLFLFMQLERPMDFFFEVVKGSKAYAFISWHHTCWKAQENKVVPSVTNLHPSSDSHTGLLQDGWVPDEKALLQPSCFNSHPVVFLLQPHSEWAKGHSGQNSCMGKVVKKGFPFVSSRQGRAKL